ncbi:MAG: tetratricopeptide repeat protein, partial [Acidobacteriota bacterium]
RGLLMQPRHITILLVLLVTTAFASPGWAEDPAAKSAADDLSKGYQAAKRGYWQEALARYEHASKKAPGDAEIWSNLGVALEAVGRWDDAGEAYRRALEIEPGNSRIRRNVVLYDEFYATYIEREGQKEKEPETGPPDDETTSPEPSDDASAEDDSTSGDATEEGADDATRS